MRVHVVAPAGFADPENPSGGNIYDQRVCAGLAELGWEVRIATVNGAWPTPGRRARTDLAAVLATIPDGETVLIDGLIASPSADPLLAHARRLRMTVLLHMPLPTEPYAETTTPPEPEQGVPDRTVLEPGRAVHGTPAAEAECGLSGAVAAESGRRGPGMSVWESECAVLGAAAGVVVTSEWTRRVVLDRYGLPVSRVRVARPGTDPAPVAPRNLASPVNGHLLCVGAIAWHKGQDVLVEALGGLASADWTCALVGALDREPAFVAELRGRVATLGLDGRIRFRGVLVGAALERAYAAADLLVVPSRLETYGMVVGEALARGVPVIATTAGGLPEALGGAAGGRAEGLVPAGDAGGLCLELGSWLGDAAYRRGLRAAALRRRGVLAGWDRTARELAAALIANR